MRIGVTGATGLVGRFVVAEALRAGDTVVALGRTPADPAALPGPVQHRVFDLSADDPPQLAGLDALVHAALLHRPGRYRGGEGDDPEGFRAANVAGTARLARAAAEAGLARIVFLSSRAVYGPHPPATRLRESDSCRPDTLYGTVKLEGERVVAAGGVPAVSLRATGVYGPAGPGRRHKWADLFDAFARGERIAPRIGSEVHGDDLAAAVRMGLTGLPPGVYNVSDILLDRAELLSEWASVTGRAGPLPDPVPDPEAFAAMDCTRLEATGWRPGGRTLLRRTLEEMAAGR